MGVLIGNDLQVDAKGRLFGNPENYHNVNGKFSKDDESPENAQEFTLFVLNIYYILMTRGDDANGYEAIAEENQSNDECDE